MSLPSSSSSPSSPPRPRAPHYSLQDRIFHRLDVPPKAREARKWVYDFLSTHSIREKPLWNSSLNEGNVINNYEFGGKEQWTKQKYSHKFKMKSKKNPSDVKAKEPNPKSFSSSSSLSTPSWSLSSSLPLSSSSSPSPSPPLPRHSHSPTLTNYKSPSTLVSEKNLRLRIAKQNLRDSLRDTIKYHYHHNNNTNSGNIYSLNSNTKSENSLKLFPSESFRSKSEIIHLATDLLKSKNFQKEIEKRVENKYNKNILQKTLREQEEEKTLGDSKLSSSSPSSLPLVPLPVPLPLSIRHVSHFPIYRHPGDWYHEDHRWSCCHSTRADSSGCQVERFNNSKYRVAVEKKQSENPSVIRRQKDQMDTMVVIPSHSGIFSSCINLMGEKGFQWSCCGKLSREAEGCQQRIVTKESKWNLE